MFATTQLVLSANSTGQDSILVLPTDFGTLLAVADGAGGTGGGAEAATLAIRLIQEQAASLKSVMDCEQLLSKMDCAIENETSGGQTTAVVIVATPTEIYGASVGDSGGWLVEGASLHILTERQVRKPLLGNGRAMPVGFKHDGFNGTILAATDGLLKYASLEKIVTALANPDLDTIPESLVALVRYPSGALPDDIGIVLCRAGK
jgi:serine/threonine protein phosphatase PrpC